MSEHTPGPWFAKGRYIGTKNHMSYIGECLDQNGNWTNETMAVANARLIAAAPDLLQALQNIVKAQSYKDACNVAGNSPEAEHAYEKFYEAIDAAQTAIAKATGKEPK